MRASQTDGPISPVRVPAATDKAPFERPARAVVVSRPTCCILCTNPVVECVGLGRRGVGRAIQLPARAPGRVRGWCKGVP